MVKREERTPGNDERTKEEKNQGEISGSIFDPEKGAAAEWGKGRRAGGGDQGALYRRGSGTGEAGGARGGGRRGGSGRKVRKRKRRTSQNPGLHFEETYNSETLPPNIYRKTFA